METYFAPAERLSISELSSEIDQICHNPVIDTVLNSVGGLVTVLNEQRQIIAANTQFLKTLNIENPQELIGLRPGEALKCEYADKMPGGCGTSKWCSSCDAAIAIVTSLGVNKSVERSCAVKLKNKGDLYLHVRAFPIILYKKKIVLLFLKDYTAEQRWASMERVFLHDVNNRIAALTSAAEYLSKAPHTEIEEMHSIILQICNQLAQEVKIQQILSKKDVSYHLNETEISFSDILIEMHNLAKHHPQSAEKYLNTPSLQADCTFITDGTLLIRILSNLIINAFEATPKHGIVKFWQEKADDHLKFCIWNESAISEINQQRIFQKNFSTKEGAGRGLGTFSAKLFSEEFLHGKLFFESSAEKGTTFTLLLPV